MKHSKTLFSLLAIALLFSACSGSKIVSSWSHKEEPKNYDKIGVLVLSSSKVARSVMEKAMVKDFKAQGINASTTLAVFPSANAQGLGVNRSEEETKKFIKSKLDENDIDALIVVAMLKREKKEGYGRRANSPDRYIGSYGPSPYYGSYYGYMSYNITQISQPGYYASSTKFFVESNLYDIESTEMIYTAQTTTKDPKTNAKKEVEHLVDIIVNDIVKKKTLKTN